MIHQQTEPSRLAHRMNGGHWLVFDAATPGGHIAGCHCGFIADLDADAGWGDSVLDHFEAVVRAECAAELAAARDREAAVTRQAERFQSGVTLHRPDTRTLHVATNSSPCTECDKDYPCPTVLAALSQSEPTKERSE